MDRRLMARVKCNACGGEYTDVLPGGARYFHACAPEIWVRVKRGLAWLDVPMVAMRPTDIVLVQRGLAQVETLVSAMLADDVRLGDSVSPRNNARDENID